MVKKQSSSASFNKPIATNMDKNIITVLELNKFGSEILDIMDNKDEFSQSDLQGVVDALVMKIYKAGVNSK